MLLLVVHSVTLVCYYQEDSIKQMKLVQRFKTRLLLGILKKKKKKKEDTGEFPTHIAKSPSDIAPKPETVPKVWLEGTLREL